MTRPVLLGPDGRPLADLTRSRLQASAGAWLAASSTAPELRDWSAIAGSPDAELEGERSAVLARARDLERNDALIAGAVQALKDSAVGFALEFQAMPDYRALGITREQARDAASAIEAIWREWAEDATSSDVTGQHDFGGLTRQATGAALVAGEALVLVLWAPKRQFALGSRFATTLQAVEADRLSNPQDRPSEPLLRDGVEIDSYGAPVAYHIRNAHPGDQWWGKGGDPPAWERVAARGPLGRRAVVHAFDQKRPGQHRGISWLAPVMAELKQRSRYQRAELQAAVVNAVIAAVLETPLDGQSLHDLFDTGDQYLNQRSNQPQVALGIGPGGAIPRLFPGERLTGYAAGRPTSAFEPFITSVCRLIAVGLGMTYETFMRDFSKTNYSSARASLLEGWRFIVYLRLLMATVWCRPILEAVIEEAVWRGYLDLPGFEASRAARRAWLRGIWKGPARGWVDPVKEVQAAAMRIRLGISTLRDEAIEQGRDIDDTLDQLQAEQVALAERGLSLPEVSFLGGSDSNSADAAEPVPA